MEEKFNIYESIRNNRVFIIEEDYPEVGVYLYVYENGRCIYDYLQDDFKMCREFALEKFNVPLNSWNLKYELTLEESVKREWEKVYHNIKNAGI
jgi:hypothetical protein